VSNRDEAYNAIHEMVGWWDIEEWPYPDDSYTSTKNGWHYDVEYGFTDGTRLRIKVSKGNETHTFTPRTYGEVDRCVAAVKLITGAQ